MLDHQSQDIATRLLDPGERLLWAGRPDPKRLVLRPQPIIFLVIGPIWTLNALSFIKNWSHPDLAFYLFMGSFVVVGIGMTLSPLWVYWLGMRTIYAVTDRRVLIAANGFSLKVESYSSIDAADLQRRERTDGTGDLVIAKRQQKDGDGDTQTVEVALTGIPAVRAVENLVRATFVKVA